jgi:hypothetical protein
VFLQDELLNACSDLAQGLLRLAQEVLRLAPECPGLLALSSGYSNSGSGPETKTGSAEKDLDCVYRGIYVYTSR